MFSSHQASQDLKLCGALQQKQNFDKTNLCCFFKIFLGVMILNGEGLMYKKLSKITVLGMNKHRLFIYFHASKKYEYDRTVFLKLCIYVTFWVSP